MNRDLWNSLSNFQTHDLVRRAFQRKHSRELNAQRTWEITSCFIQAEEYFRSAHYAAETVRPLLLYYGVQSISRGMILFLNSNTKEESLKQSHGLSAKDWKGILSQTTPSVLDLEVTVENGTFTDLVTVTDPLQKSLLPMEDGGILFDPVGSRRGVQSTDSIKFDDILSRIISLGLIYHDVTERRENLRTGAIFHTEVANIVRVLHEPVMGASTAEEVRSLFSVPKNIEIGLLPHEPTYPYPHFAYRIERSATGEYPATCPIIDNANSDGFGYLIVPWPNDVYVSSLSKCYLVAYILGMLVRYFPSYWMSLIRGQKGDAALPLLRAAIEHVETDFPRMALALLN